MPNFEVLLELPPSVTLLDFISKRIYKFFFWAGSWAAPRPADIVAREAGYCCGAGEAGDGERSERGERKSLAVRVEGWTACRSRVRRCRSWSLMRVEGGVRLREVGHLEHITALSDGRVDLARLPSHPLTHSSTIVFELFHSSTHPLTHSLFHSDS